MQYRYLVNNTEQIERYRVCLIICEFLLQVYIDNRLLETQQVQDAESMLVQRWYTVYDSGPTLNQH